MFHGSRAARAARWSNDLIRSALIRVLLLTMYSSVREGEEGATESGMWVCSSGCRDQRRTSVFRRCVREFLNESAGIKKHR